MESKNINRAYQKTRSNKETAYSLDKQAYSALIDDAYNNALKDVTDFEATILSIKDKLVISEDTKKRVTTRVDGNKPANFYEVIVRPNWLNNVPKPWTFKGFKKGSQNILDQSRAVRSAIEAHPVARSDATVNSGQVSHLKCGDIVLCTWGDGPNNSGRYRDIRFKIHKIGEDPEVIAAGWTSAKSVFGQSGDLLGGGEYTGDPGTWRWEGMHKGVWVKAKPNLRTYTGAESRYNGQKVYNGALPSMLMSKFSFQRYNYQNDTLEKERSILVVYDAYQSLVELNNLWKQEFPKGDIPLGQCYRTWQGQIDAVGNKSAQPGRSKHGWGCAIDFKTERKYQPNRQGPGWPSTVYKWLRRNQHQTKWHHPSWAKKGAPMQEWWHFEYSLRHEIFSPEDTFKTYPVSKSEDVDNYKDPPKPKKKRSRRRRKKRK